MTTTTTTMNPVFIRVLDRTIGFWEENCLDFDEQKLKKFNEDNESLLEILENGLAYPQFHERTAELLITLTRLSQLNDYWSDWVNLLVLTLDAIGDKNLLIRARLLNRLGFLYGHQYRIQEAIQLHLEAVELSKLCNNDYHLGESYYYLAGNYMMMRDHKRAVEPAQMAAQLFAKISPPEAIKMGASANQLGWIYDFQGDLQKARDCYEKGARLFAEAGEFSFSMRAMRYIGHVDALMGNIEKAFIELDKTDAKAEEYKVSLYDKYYNSAVRAEIYRHENCFPEAKEIATHAHSIAYKTDHTALQGVASMGLGIILAEMGEAKDARPHLNEAINKLQSAPDTVYDLAITQAYLAYANYCLGRKSEEINHINSTLKFLDKYGDTHANIEKRRIRHLLEKML